MGRHAGDVLNESVCSLPQRLFFLLFFNSVSFLFLLRVPSVFDSDKLRSFMTVTAPRGHKQRVQSESAFFPLPNRAYIGVPRRQTGCLACFVCLCVCVGGCVRACVCVCVCVCVGVCV